MALITQSLKLLILQLNALPHTLTDAGTSTEQAASVSEAVEDGPAAAFLQNSFFNLEMKNGQSRIIHSLRTATRRVLTEPSDIHSCAVEVYSDLYLRELVE